MRMMFELYVHVMSILTFDSFFFSLSIKALQLATAANESFQGKDWWWLVQLGKCYHR